MISKLLKKNEKGFTLMEMLIVVAIIAVLVAIAIPTFNSSLNKAKEATDEANIRAGYASTMMKILQADLDSAPITSDKTYYLKADGTVTETKPTAVTEVYQCKGSNTDTSVDVAGQSKTWNANDIVYYQYNKTSGAVTINTSATIPA